MNEQWWSWALTAVGVSCFWLAGRKVWWAWYVGLIAQVLWLAYSLVTQQWGFLVGVGAYGFVYVKNCVSWTREHLRKRRYHFTLQTYLDVLTRHDRKLSDCRELDMVKFRHFRKLVFARARREKVGESSIFYQRG